MTYSEIKKDVKEKLSEERYKHVLGTVEMAERLAKMYDVSPKKAKLAALLHDIAKEYTKYERDLFCKLNDLKMADYEKRSDKIVHSFLGAEVAKLDYKITDEQILDAIRYHTTGRPNMTTLEKIIYVSDFIEPNRDSERYIEKVQIARGIVEHDLTKTVAYILHETLLYIPPKDLYKLTKEAYEFYKNELE